jgi:hypothetical protein
MKAWSTSHTDHRMHLLLTHTCTNAPFQRTHTQAARWILALGLAPRLGVVPAAAAAPAVGVVRAARALNCSWAGLYPLRGVMGGLPTA